MAAQSSSSDIRQLSDGKPCKTCQWHIDTSLGVAFLVVITVLLLQVNGGWLGRVFKYLGL